MIDHPVDDLSALLDGESTGIDVAEIEAHLEVCAGCREELDGTRTARAELRSLPAVEPPPGFLESLAPGSNVVPLRRRRAVAANIAAAAVAAFAALALLTGAATSPVSAVSAEPTGALDRHDETVSAMSAGLGGPSPRGLRSTPTTAPAMDEVPAGFAAPESLVGYRLAGRYQIPDGVHLLYEKDDHRLSVFEQAGALGSLPPEGTWEEGIWRWDADSGARIAVTERGGVVLTVVGDESADVVLAAARALDPEAAGEPLLDRVRSACADALESLSPAS